MLVKYINKYIFFKGGEKLMEKEIKLSQREQRVPNRKLILRTIKYGPFIIYGIIAGMASCSLALGNSSEMDTNRIQQQENIFNK